MSTALPPLPDVPILDAEDLHPNLHIEGAMLGILNLFATLPAHTYISARYVTDKLKLFSVPAPPMFTLEGSPALGATTNRASPGHCDWLGTLLLQHLVASGCVDRVLVDTLMQTSMWDQIHIIGYSKRIKYAYFISQTSTQEEVEPMRVLEDPVFDWNDGLNISRVLEATPGTSSQTHSPAAFCPQSFATRHIGECADALDELQQHYAFAQPALSMDSVEVEPMRVLEDPVFDWNDGLNISRVLEATPGTSSQTHSPAAFCPQSFATRHIGECADALDELQQHYAFAQPALSMDSVEQFLFHALQNLEPPFDRPGIKVSHADINAFFHVHRDNSRDRGISVPSRTLLGKMKGIFKGAMIDHGVTHGIRHKSFMPLAVLREAFQDHYQAPACIFE